MKKKILALSILLSVISIQAKEITVVVRGVKPISPDKTEVTSHSNGVTDTLVVSPSKKATAIYVYLKDINRPCNL